MLTYRLIGTPNIESEYSDEMQTTLSVVLRREDGVEGTAWVSAGVRPQDRGTSLAAGCTGPYTAVTPWLYASALSEWCDPRLLPAPPTEDECDADPMARGTYDASELPAAIDAMMAAVRDVVMAMHRDRIEVANAR